MTFDLHVWGRACEMPIDNPMLFTERWYISQFYNRLRLMRSNRVLEQVVVNVGQYEDMVTSGV